MKILLNIKSPIDLDAFIALIERYGWHLAHSQDALQLYEHKDFPLRQLALTTNPTHGDFQEALELALQRVIEIHNPSIAKLASILPALRAEILHAVDALERKGLSDIITIQPRF